MTLINTLREIFTNYGTTEEINTDRAGQFTPQPFKQFLQNWTIWHCLSSAYYPKSNDQAELAVKVSKRIIYDNTNPECTLTTNKAVRAILQNQNTPLLDISLNPAQLLFHHQLREHLPTHLMYCQLHKDWAISCN